MSTERKLIPCEEDDPNRCKAQGDIREGQCKFLAVEDEIYCPKHGGSKMAEKRKQEKLHDYRLQVWQQRLDEFAESDKVKNLRGEIGVLRLMIESILNMCKDPQELILYSGRVSDLVVKVEKCVTSCQNFESKMGMMLDKSAALLLASKIVDIIGQHVTDPQTIDNISNGIIDILKDLGSKPLIQDD